MIQLVAEADLEITKVATPSPATAGQSMTYTITAKNNGPSAALNVSATDNLPAGFNVTSVTPTAGTIWTAPDWTIGTLLPNQSVTLTVVGMLDASIPHGTVISNTATVTSTTYDPDLTNNTDVEDVTVNGRVDLAINKASVSSTYTPGTSVTWTITVTNTGPSDVVNALVNDDINNALTNVSWSAVATGSASVANASGTGDILNEQVSIAAGAGNYVTYTVTAYVPSGYTGDLVNTATVTAPNGVTDNNQNNNTDTETDTQNSVADLDIDKASVGSTYTPGTSVTWTITVTNAGPSDVVNALVNDDINNALTNVSWSAVATGSASVANASGTGDILNEQVSIAAGAGNYVTYTVTAYVPSGYTGDLVNTATVTAPNGVTDNNQNNNTDTETDTQNSVADLAIDKASVGSTYTPGTSVTWTITVTNAGPSDVVNALVNDDINNALTNVSWSAVATGSASVANASGTGDILNEQVSIAAGAGNYVTYTVTAYVPSGFTGNLVNTATVTAPNGVTDNNQNNNTDTETDMQNSVADLAIDKASVGSTYTPGTSVTWTITVTNAGPSDVVNALVNDDINNALTNVSWSAVATGSASVANASGTGDILNEQVSIAAGAGNYVTYTVTAYVPSGFTGDLVNTATVTAPNGVTDNNQNNNTDTETDTQNSVADLAIDKASVGSTYTPGTSVTWTITVTNVGPSDVVNALVNDDINNALTNVSWSAVATGSASVTNASGTGDILNEQVSIAAGAGNYVTYTVTAYVPSGFTGSLVNTATVTAPNGVTDNNQNNNTDTETDTQNSVADLAIDKASVGSTYTPGTSVTWTITVTNAGPSDVVNALVNDDINNALTNVSWSAVATGSASVTNASGTGDILNEQVSIAAGAGNYVTYTVTTYVPSGFTGSLVNTATVTAPNGVTDNNQNNNTDTETDTQNSVADLAIDKASVGSTYTPGTSVTWTITVTNAGPSDVVNALVNDDINNALTNVSWSAVATGSALVANASGTGDILNEQVSIAAGAGNYVTYTVTAYVPSGFTGNLVNTATVTAPNGVTDNNQNNNTDTDTDTQNSVADLSVAKSSVNATYTPGVPVTYTVLVSNAGPSDVVGASLVDNAPAGTTISSWSATGSTGSVYTTSGSGNISELVNIPSGGSITYTITVNVPSGYTGDLVNTATVTAPNGVTDNNQNNNTDTETDTQNSVADLSVAKSSVNATYTPGVPVTYTVLVSNAGPSDVVGASVVDNAPAGTTISSWSATGSTGTVYTASGSGNISELVNIPSGGSITYTITVNVPSGYTGDLVNTATVTAPNGVTDNNQNNNTDTETDTQNSVADLSVAKSSVNATYTPGVPVTYTVLVSNAGPSDVVGASVVDNAPAGTTISSWSATGSTGTVYTASGSGNISELVNIPSGGSITYTITVNVPSGFTGNLVNTATVTAPNGVTDNNQNNNTDTETDTQNSVADLSVAKSSVNATYTPGVPVTYTVLVSNAGPSDVVGASLVDNALAGTTISSWSATGSTGSVYTTSGSGNISELVNIPSGGSITYTITVNVPSGYTGDLVNTATVTAPNGVTDNNQNNNTDTETDTQNSVADLSVAKSSVNATYTPGVPVTYTVLVSNAGPSDVVGASVVDNAPAGTTISSWSATGSTGTVYTASGSGNISELVNIPSGGSIIYTITVNVPSGFTGNLVNTATVTAPNGVTDNNQNNNTDTETDTQNSVADLSVAKSSVNATYTPGVPVTYTVLVSNAGPSDVVGASLVDNAPAGTTISSWSATGSTGSVYTTSGSGNISELVNIPSGGSITYTITVNVPSGYTGDLVNTATVTAPNGVTDNNQNNNTDTETDTQNSVADLSVAKSSVNATYTPGVPVTYTVLVSNAGPSDVVGASVVDNAPAGTTISSWSATGSTGTVYTASGSGNISELVNIPSGGSITYTITVNVPSGYTGDLVNTATVTAPNGVTDNNQNNNTDTETDTQNSVADLSVAKSSVNATYTPGVPVTYTVLVSNAGPSDVVGASVVDNAPAGTTISSWSATGSTGTVYTASGSGNISELVNIPSGGSITYTITVNVPSGYTGDLVNTATVTAPNGVTDNNQNNNTDTETDTQNSVADLSVAKSSVNATYTPGVPVTYTVLVSNAGPSDVVGASVVDNAPAGTTISSWSATGSTGTVYTASGSGNISELVNIPSGGSITYTITVNVPSGYTGDLVNTATVTAPNGVTDNNQNNNTDTETDTQNSVADLSVAKSSVNATYTPGVPVTYTVLVSNAGPSDVVGASVVDNAPAGTTISSWSATGSTGTVYTASGSGNISELVNIPSGGSITYTITVNVPSGYTGDLVNTATVTAPNGVTDNNQNNNTDTETDLQNSVANLKITKTGAPDPVIIGQTLTYTITVTNDGPSDAQNVTVSDPLPAGLTFVSASNSGVFSAGNVTWSLGTLVSGASVQLTLVTTVNMNSFVASITNSVSVTSTTFDPDHTNNTASDLTYITPVISVNDVSVVEGNTLRFNITLSNPSALDVDFTPSFTDITATGGIDYTQTNLQYSFDGIIYFTWTGGIITFPAGTSSLFFDVPSIQDIYDEINETFTLTVTSPVAGSDIGTGTILDNDIEISGTVFHDLNKLTDGYVNGTGTNADGMLYANLVNPATGQVIASVPVGANGHYVFNSNFYPVMANTNYLVILTETQQNTGNLLFVADLPLHWNSTGEFVGTGPGHDGQIDSRLLVTTTAVGVIHANFGIIKVPDVTPVITAVPNVMNGPTNFYITVRVTELNMVATEGTITVLIPKDQRWDLTAPGYNPALTQLGAFTMNNNVWSYSQDPTYHIFTTTSSIPAGGFSYFGFHANWNSGQTKGIYTVTSQIVSGSGGENRIDNNVDAEKIDYFIY
jgi:uncharacterized repeat protein (TIGR01451 family)